MLHTSMTGSFVSTLRSLKHDHNEPGQLALAGSRCRNIGKAAAERKEIAGVRYEVSMPTPSPSMSATAAVDPHLLVPAAGADLVVDAAGDEIGSAVAVPVRHANAG